MRSLIRMGLALVCLLPLSSTATLADATSDAKKAIQGIYDKVDAAAGKKDVKGVTSHLTSDYQSLSAKGVKLGDAAQLKTQVEMVFKQVQSIKAKSQIQKFALKGSTATVTVKQNGTIVVMNPQTRKPSVVAVESVSEDIWVKSSGSWKEKSSKNTSSKQSMDGKPIAAPGGN